MRIMREDAIQDYIIPAIREMWNKECCKEIIKALYHDFGDTISRQEAIEALGEEPMNWTDSDRELQAIEDYKMTKKMLEELPSANVQPCNNAIDKQEVLDAIDKWYSETDSDMGIMEVIEQLSPVVVECTGYWIKIKPYPLQMHDYECSECGHETDDDTEKYCCECGCRILVVKNWG